MISVVIPTYKSPEALDLCLKSAIEGQSEKNEIIVVVDGFYDLNKEVLEKYRSSIDILILDENQGLCRATNLGVYNTSKDRLLIVNDDNVFQKGWDSTLSKLDIENTVWTPNQVEPIPSMFKQFDITNLGRDLTNFDLEGCMNYLTNIGDDRFENSGSTLPIYMKKLDYMKVGGWDENYPKGMVADWDFFLKCQLSGLKMHRTYNTHFYHFVSLSVNDILLPGESQTLKSVKRREAEIVAHQYARYKWGAPIKSCPLTNLKYV